MTFKVGDMVRRKPEYRCESGWPYEGETMVVKSDSGQTVHLEGDPEKSGWASDYFELAKPVTPESCVTAWSDAEIGPFDVSVNSKTDLSAVDTLNRLWFNDPVGQKLNQITLEYQESADMTEDQLVTKILTEMESMDQVTRVLISWKSRPNGIAWDRDWSQGGAGFGQPLFCWR